MMSAVDQVAGPLASIFSAVAISWVLVKMFAIALVSVTSVIVLAYGLSKRRGSIKRASEASLRRLYVRGEITLTAYEQELERRRGD